MKIRNTLFTLALLWSTNASAQDYPGSFRQQIGIGPYVGYDAARSSVVYGATALYEFRPFKRIGFTAAATYDFNPYKNETAWLPDEVGGITEVGGFQVKQGFLSLSGGVRFYFKRFFIAAGLGGSFNHIVIKVDETGETADGDRKRLYQTYGVGYRLTLKEKRQLELFLNNTSGGVPPASGLPKMELGVRYVFGFN